MSTLLSQPRFRAQHLDPPRKRWTREEYLALEKAGVLCDQKLELIEGELISKMGKNRPHVNTLTRVFLALVKLFGEAYVNPEAPIDVSAADNVVNEPEPDVIVLKRDSGSISSRNPMPGELHLVVEVSDTTLTFDLTTKASLYARAEIAEYWVVDVRGQKLIVHRAPKDGQYTSIEAYGESESLSPLGAQGKQLLVSSIV